MMLKRVNLKVGFKAKKQGLSIIRQMRSVKIDKTITTEEMMKMTRGYRIDDK